MPPHGKEGALNLNVSVGRLEFRPFVDRPVDELFHLHGFKFDFLVRQLAERQHILNQAVEAPGGVSHFGEQIRSG